MVRRTTLQINANCQSNKNKYRKLFLSCEITYVIEILLLIYRPIESATVEEADKFPDRVNGKN